MTVTIDADTPVFRWWLQEDLVLPLARTDLADGALGSPPDTWRDPDYARRRYREELCARRDLGLWTCESFGAAEACRARFEALASAFREEWQEERDAYLSQLEDPDQVGRDVRRANLANAFLADANLRMARMEGAILTFARIEGADLGGARMEGADLRGARMERAYLRGAGLEEANLGGARLEGADLTRARLEGADLGEARMVGAYLRGAQLEGAHLGGAWLEGADLSGARLEGADLRYADFRKSKWAGASNRASLAHFADFRGAQDLMQAQLEGLIGNASTLLPDGPTRDTGEPYFVWRCWDQPPADLDRIVTTAAGPGADDTDRSALRAQFLCAPDNPRRKTGTPLALDAPYAEGHPLAYEQSA